MLKKGLKIKEVQVTMEDRIAGQSIYSGLFSSLKYMLNIMISILFIS